jgi:hypothetical protein
MRRFAAMLAVAATAAVARAGVTYDFLSVSSGTRETILAGTATTDRGRMRIDITRGDGGVLRNNTVALSMDGGRALRIIDPSSRTYYDVDLEQLLGGVGAIEKKLDGRVTVRVENVRVTSHDMGDGGTIEGYATRRQLIDTEYDLVLDAFGQKSTTHVLMSVESWLTDALPARSAFQLAGGKSGIGDIDKLIAAQSGAAKGFPLKQITAFSANEIHSTTTVTVSGIRTLAVNDGTFATPAGFHKRRGRT